MKLWFLTDTKRVAHEKDAVETVASKEQWLEFERWVLRDGCLTALSTIIAHGVRYPVRLVYPDQFPDVPAWVEPQTDARWSTHQYGSGSLCLELRPDNWVATATGADVLRSAYHLLELENPLGEGGALATAPSAHDVGEVQRYDWGVNPILIGQGCCDRLKAETSQDPKALRWQVRDNVWPILVHDGQDRASRRRPPGADLQDWRFEIDVYVSLNAPPAGTVGRKNLVDAGDFDGAIAEKISGKGAALVLFMGGAKPVAYHLFDENEAHLRKVFVLPDQGEARSGRPEASCEKSVAIIGVGSVGSKIAESLVRSGIARLTLIDGDVMLPANLERHALDWRDVGFRKVYGVQRRLLDVAPGADIKVVDQNLNWQRSARTHAWQVESIASCDLILDATGDASTALFLGAVAAANRRPFVSVEVYEGGIGALIASCLPERDPAFADARAAFFSWCDLQPTAPPMSSSRRYEALAEDGTPMVADDAAVTMTAGHASRVVLDILDGQPAGAEAAWLLIGFRKGWVFDGHAHTIRMSVGSPPQPQANLHDADAYAFVSALVKEHIDAGAAEG